MASDGSPSPAFLESASRLGLSLAGADPSLRPINQPVHDLPIAVDPAVAQEGPVAPDTLQVSQIAFHDQDLFLLAGCFTEHNTKRVAYKRSAPKLQSTFGRAFVAHTIHCGYVDPIGNGMGALHRSPGIMLRVPVLSFLSRVPPDGGRIEQNFGALQGGQPRSFGIPLIPANQHANAPISRVESIGNLGRPA